MSTDLTTPAAEATAEVTTPAAEVTTPAAEVTAPAAEVALADYEFALPEGLDPANIKLDDIKAFAKDLGLDPVADKEKAQKILDRVLQQRTDFETAQQTAKDEVLADWAKQAREDAEIGGDKFEPTLAAARSVIANDKIVSPGFKEFLETTGLGNHPEMIRVFARLSPLFANDSPVPGGGGSPKGDPIAGIYDHPSSQPSQ